MPRWLARNKTGTSPDGGDGPYSCSHSINHYIGCSDPPYDFELWGALIGRLGQHLVDRYGIEEMAAKWSFEVWCGSRESKLSLARSRLRLCPGLVGVLDSDDHPHPLALCDAGVMLTDWRNWRLAIPRLALALALSLVIALALTLSLALAASLLQERAGPAVGCDWRWRLVGHRPRVLPALRRSCPRAQGSEPEAPRRWPSDHRQQRPGGAGVCGLVPRQPASKSPKKKYILNGHTYT